MILFNDIILLNEMVNNSWHIYLVTHILTRILLGMTFCRAKDIHSFARTLFGIHFAL